MTLQVPECTQKQRTSEKIPPSNQQVLETTQQNPVAESTLHSVIYSNMFIVPKKDGGQRPEQTCEIRAFQDGGPPHSQSSTKEKQLVDLKDGPNSPPTPISTSLQDGEEDISVQLPPLQLVHSPKSIHNDTQTSGGDAQISEHPTGNLHG